MKKEKKVKIQSKPLDAVEWEIIRADIAMLKAEAKKLGHYEKWLKSQELFGLNWRKSNRELVDRTDSEISEQLYGPDPRIKKKKKSTPKK